MRLFFFFFFCAFVTKDPYYPYPQNYPYPQDWFGHDEEDADDLAKD